MLRVLQSPCIYFLMGFLFGSVIFSWYTYLHKVPVSWEKPVPNCPEQQERSMNAPARLGGSDIVTLLNFRERQKWLERPFGLCFLEQAPTLITGNCKILDLHVAATDTVVFYRIQDDLTEYVKVHFEAKDPQEYRLQIIEQKAAKEGTASGGGTMSPIVFRFVDGKASERNWCLIHSISMASPLAIISSREIASNGEIIFYLHFAIPAESLTDDKVMGFAKDPESYIPDRIFGQLVRLHYKP